MKRDRGQPLRIPATAGTDFNTQDANNLPNRALAFERWLAKSLLRAAGDPAISIVLWNGDEINTANTAYYRMHILDRSALISLCINPDLQFGELFTEGRIQIEGDLEDFLVALNRGLIRAGSRSKWSSILSKLYLLKRNTIDRAKDNIYHHYDLGNDFYKIWLDEQMVYTCAYFPTPELSLEQAQVAKLDHVARKLRLKPGQHVVEAGCGWGALALHMARHYDVTVSAYNISKEQLAFARERAEAQGLEGRVEFIERDYREIDQPCDAFVSVGMLEHVGVKYFAELGTVIDRVLAPEGLGLVHSIGRNRPAPMNAWIERRIFPGAYPPSFGECAQLFEPFALSVLDVENLRLHYAMTLRHWLQRFEAHIQQVRDQFDEPFIRAWRLYLAGSVAAFETGELQLFQIVFSRFTNNRVPMTREHLYS